MTREMRKKTPANLCRIAEYIMRQNKDATLSRARRNPTISEIKRGVGMSHGGVVSLLAHMEAQGMITRDSLVPRSIELRQRSMWSKVMQDAWADYQKNK